ncbi:MAG TPA: hypothetical protein VFY93_09410 [Planctomycetota bacterium]|nr:hypothetical protein [Planctomycetota bacterium]
MRNAVFLLLLVAVAAGEESLEERLAEKLKKPFAKNALWVLDFGEAKTLAAEKGKVIFGYFSRSYAP